jgi:hypothetical protein
MSVSNQCTRLMAHSDPLPCGLAPCFLHFHRLGLDSVRCTHCFGFSLRPLRLSSTFLFRKFLLGLGLLPWKSFFQVGACLSRNIRRLPREPGRSSRRVPSFGRITYCFNPRFDSVSRLIDGFNLFAIDPLVASDPTVRSQVTFYFVVVCSHALHFTTVRR